jgi:hypothetical protein
MFQSPKTGRGVARALAPIQERSLGQLPQHHSDPSKRIA